MNMHIETETSTKLFTTNSDRSGKKIAKDEKTDIASIQQPSSKPITLPFAIPKVAKKKNTDYYAMNTVKAINNIDTGMEERETIDLILGNCEEENKPREDITKEIQLSYDDDNQKLSNADTAEEIIDHVCGKCFKSFRRINSLQKHLDFCRFDSSYHLRKAEMLKNLEKIEKDSVIMEKKDVCFCCGENYDTCHLGHISCPDCPKSFKTQISYERHIFITHAEFNDYPCSICNAMLRSANLLKLHEQQHRFRGKPFACKLCGKDFTKNSHLLRHQKHSSCSANTGYSISCKVCNREFNRKDSLKVHLKQHLGTAVLKKTEYACPICKKCFYSPSALNIHMRTHTGEKPFDCDLCEKKFPSTMALKKHRRSHTGEKPYICLVCKRSYAAKEVLNRHMKLHTGKRPHVCSECGKAFIQTKELRSHLKTHLMPYECNKCSAKFKTEKQLAHHINEHNTVKRTSNSAEKRKRTHLINKCYVCKISFTTDLELEKHIQEDIHTTPAERCKRKTRTDCAVCKLNFDTIQNLQFHVLGVHQEDFVNKNPFHSEQQNNENDILLLHSSKVIRIEDAQGERIEFVTTDNKGEILNTNAYSLKQQKNLKTNDNRAEESKVNNLKQCVVDVCSETAITVIPLETKGDIIDPITTKNLAIILSPDSKEDQRKTLAKCLTAAVCDNNETKQIIEIKQEFSKENLKLKHNIGKLINMLVDGETLKKFGWPNITEEIVLCKVIQNCGHDLFNDQQNCSGYDYATRMREYVKLLFTVVIHNDSIKELLNNYTIDEVIEHILDNDNEGDDDENDNKNYKENVKTIKQKNT